MADTEERPRKRAKRLSLGGLALQQLQENDDAAEKEAARQKASEQRETSSSGPARKRALAPIAPVQQATVARSMASKESFEKELFPSIMDLYQRGVCVLCTQLCALSLFPFCVLTCCDSLTFFSPLSSLHLLSVSC